MSSTLTEEERDLLAQLRDKHPAIKAKRLPNGALFVVRKPGREYDRSLNRVGEKNAQMFNIQRDLVLSCVVHPTREEAVRLLQEYPAAVPRLADACSEMAGAEVEDVGED